MVKVEFSGAVVYRLGGIKETRTGGATLLEVLLNLESDFPPLKGALVSQGKPSRLYFLYLNGQDVRKGAGEDMPVPEDSVLRIMNALTGG